MYKIKGKYFSLDIDRSYIKIEFIRRFNYKEDIPCKTFGIIIINILYNE